MKDEPGQRMKDEPGQRIHQATLVLPYFDYEVPVLYVADGKAYIPVVAVCRMLGLRADTHIARWRRLLVWDSARKLPLQTTRGTRMVWCLQLGMVPFLYSCFSWSLVSPERQEQLRQATDAALQAIEQAQQEMLRRYRLMRRHLLRFLVAYTQADSQLDQVAQRAHARLNRNAWLQFEVLLSQGRTLIQEATAFARTLVQEQATDLIVDVVTLEADGQMTQVDTFPLFPVISRQDEERFSAYLSRLTQWGHQVFAFLDEQGLPGTPNSNEETYQ